MPGYLHSPDLATDPAFHRNPNFKKPSTDCNRSRPERVNQFTPISHHQDFFTRFPPPPASQASQVSSGLLAGLLETNPDPAPTPTLTRNQPPVPTDRLPSNSEQTGNESSTPLVSLWQLYQFVFRICVRLFPALASPVFGPGRP